MRAERLEELTPRQRDCLRLLLTGRTAKQIGLLLGISDETVEAHLKRARKSLGVSDSGEAARMLAAYEEGATHRVGNHSPQLPESQIKPAGDTAQPDMGLPQRIERTGRFETSMLFEPLRPGPRHLGGWLLRHRGQRRNDLSLDRRILATASLTWLMILTPSVTLIGIVMLFQWLTGIAKTGG